MIAIDTSAILVLLLAEEEAREFRDVIRRAGRVAVSAGTAVELAAVSSRNDALFDAALSFLDEPYVTVEPVDAAQVAVAAQAYRQYGKATTLRASIWATSSPLRWLASATCRCCSRATISHGPTSNGPRVSVPSAPPRRAFPPRRRTPSRRSIKRTCAGNDGSRHEGGRIGNGQVDLRQARDRKTRNAGQGYRKTVEGLGRARLRDRDPCVAYTAEQPLGFVVLRVTPHSWTATRSTRNGIGRTAPPASDSASNEPAVHELHPNHVELPGALRGRETPASHRKPRLFNLMVLHRLTRPGPWVPCGRRRPVDSTHPTL